MITLPGPTLVSGAALFGVDPNSLNSLGGSDGAVYSCRRGSRACILKFVPKPPDRLAEYEEKLAFLLYLAGNGVPIAAPLESADGRRYEVLPSGDAQYVVTLTYQASGRHPTPRNPYDWTERLFEGWGQVMGRMHALARAYPRWQAAAPGDDGPPSLINDWRSEHEFFAGWCQEPKIVEQWRRLYDPLAALPRERGGFGLVHNDLHMWNILYNPDASSVGQTRPAAPDERRSSPITIIDFDVCAYHWFIADLAIPVYHGVTFSARRSMAQREASARQFLQPFMTGYRRENDLDPAWLERLPLFLRYREILSYIALSNDWPEDRRAPWQVAMLAEKRARILRGEPVIARLA